VGQRPRNPLSRLSVPNKGQGGVKFAREEGMGLSRNHGVWQSWPKKAFIN